MAHFVSVQTDKAAGAHLLWATDHKLRRHVQIGSRSGPQYASGGQPAADGGCRALGSHVRAATPLAPLCPVKLRTSDLVCALIAVEWRCELGSGCPKLTPCLRKGCSDADMPHPPSKQDVPAVMVPSHTLSLSWGAAMHRHSHQCRHYVFIIICQL